MGFMASVPNGVLKGNPWKYPVSMLCPCTAASLLIPFVFLYFLVQCLAVPTSVVSTGAWSESFCCFLTVVIAGVLLDFLALVS